MKNKQRRIHATFMAAALLLTTGFGSGISLIHADADYLNSVTVVMDEELGDLNILTRTKGSYSADMVYTMIYDRLLTLDKYGNFVLELIETWDIIEESGFIGGSPTIYPSGNNYAPGWEDIPEFGDIHFRDSTGYDIATCTLREGVEFRNNVELTVDSLINLVDFAKAQPTDTLIYQTWAPVMITYLDDHTFILGVNTEGFNFGLMDVMYNLASPQGSIFYVEDGILESTDYPIGSGAYELEEVDENGDFVRFERWNGWWSEETVPTQYVTFEYSSNSEAAETAIINNYANAVVIRDQFDDDIYIDSYEDSRDYYWTEENGKRYFLIEENPFALFFNTDPTKSIFGEAVYRQAASAALNKDELHIAGALKHDSDDFWCNLSNSDGSSTLPVNNLAWAQNWIDELGSGVPSGTVIDVVVYDNNYFSNDTYEQYYYNVCNSVQYYLNALFGSDEAVNFISASESQMAAYEANGNYDIMLKEIDLHNVNSAHNVLYGKGNYEIDRYLEYASRSADGNAFARMHLDAQTLNYTESVYVTNLGWQKRAVVYNENVSGISVCEKFCPTGDASTLDFRFIAVTAD